MKRARFALLLPILCLAAQLACLASDPVPWRPSSATHAVQVTRVEWRDAARDRVVPVKLYAPADGKGPYPVILFSHGLGGSREGYEYLGQFWASHGYVSVHLQHAGSDDAVWRDARLGERMAAMRRAAAQPKNAVDRVHDVIFVLDQLTSLHATNSEWKGRLDLEAVGIAGHSFGAHMTLASVGARYSPVWRGNSCFDSRLKAAIPMSAPVPADQAHLDEAYAGVKVPCLHLTGTEDYSPIGDTKAAERRLPYDHCKNSDQYLITFTGGDHMIFSGRERRAGGAKDAQFQGLICESSLAFWDSYLGGDPKAKTWLRTKFASVLGREGVFEMQPTP